MAHPTTRIRCEQAIYGSFPFWDRGYAILAQSPGCRPEWLAEFLAACQKHGEPPSHTPTADALFAIRLPSGPRAVVGVGSPGVDDRGRPGALVFHGLFLSGRDFRRIGSDPFALADRLVRCWGPETTALPSATWDVATPTRPGPDAPADPQADRIAAIVAGGRRYAVESAGPIDDLARRAWARLPDRARRRVSLATLAFANGNHFDLAAFPRLAGIALDASYIVDHPDHPAEPAPRPRPQVGRRGWAALGGLAGLSGVALALAWPSDDRGPAAPDPRPSEVPVAPALPPPPRADDESPPPPEDAARAVEALVDLAERSGIEVGSGPVDPGSLMVRISDGLRHRGPWLSAAERSELASAGPDDLDRAAALAWDARARRFAADRPLPPEFAAAPLRRQLDQLAWSFHLEPEPAPGRSVAEAAQAFAEGLAVDIPVRPNPLAARYPALDAYARFLSKLPRR